MKTVICWVIEGGGARAGRRGLGRNAALDSVAADYLSRLKQYTPVEARSFCSEEAFLEAVGRLGGRTAPVVALLDGRGRMFSSQEFAGWLGRQRDGGAQTLILAIGPADGWSPAAREAAGMLISLGALTLPHELARVVLMEQVYRGFTILAGHPYHRE